MNVFEFLQFDPAGFRQTLKELDTRRDKLKLILSLAGQIALASALCISFVMLFSALFGPANSVVAVTILLCVQLFRGSGLGIRPTHGVWAVLLLFAVLAAGPEVAALLPPGWSFAANAGFIFLLVLIGCYNASMSNQVILVLSYLLLMGLGVSGHDLAMRFAALGVGAAITAGAYWWCRSAADDDEASLADVFRSFSLANERSRWQVRLALGVASSILFSELIGWDRPVWAGISTMSVMMPVREASLKCVRQRFVWNIASCAIFLGVNAAVPLNTNNLMGLFTDVGFGLTASLLWESMVNVALTAFTVPAYDLPFAVLVRLAHNLMGATWGWASGSALDRLLGRFRRKLQRDAQDLAKLPDA